jgi:hypothetical protein
MKKAALCTFAAAAALGAMVVEPKDASATAYPWWVRTSGALCVADIENQDKVGPDITYLGSMFTKIVGQSSGLIKTTAMCSFAQDEIHPDNNVTSITVDLNNPTGATLPAGSLVAEACIFSGWVVSCGGTTSSPAITTATPHDSMSLGDISKWTGDTGNGYAAVVLMESNSDASWIGGLFYAGSNSGGI